MANLAAWWPLGALIFSFIGAAIIGFNQWAQIESRALLAARFAGVVPLALLAWLVLPWPVVPAVYAVGAVMGVVFALADFLLFRASARYGGRLAALYVPLKMLVVFAGWLLLDPAQAQAMVAEPVRLGLILVFFALAAYALAHIRKHDASWRALLAVVPVAVLFALGDVVIKLLAPPLEGASYMATLGAITAYLFTANLATACVGVVALGGLPRLNRQGWWRAAGFGALLYGGIAFLLLVVCAAPNPGYVGAIAMLSALWLALWGRFVQHERNDLGAGLLLLVAALGVALLAV